MQDPSGNPSYGDNPPLGAWQPLAHLMLEVKTIMEALDDQPKFNEYNDGTAHNYVVRLDEVLKKMSKCTPKGYLETIRQMEDHLRAACRHLNEAANKYKNKPSEKYAFQTRLNRSRKCLEKCLDIWQAILEKYLEVDKQP